MILARNILTAIRMHTFLKVLALMTAGGLSFNVLASNALAAQNIGQKTDFEVIEVTGEHQLGWYREQRYKKEIVFYDSMNDLIEDEEFHVTCKRIFRHNNSRISKRYCQPQFFDTLKQDIAFERTSLRSPNHMVIEPMSDAQYRRAVELKRQEMAALVAEKIKESPELAQKLQDLMDARKAYQLAHAEKFGDLSQHVGLLDSKQGE